MSTIKDQLVENIVNCRSATLNERQIARKMFLLDPTFAFKDDTILGFKILNTIAEKFKVPLCCVKVAGSARSTFSVIPEAR